MPIAPLIFIWWKHAKFVLDFLLYSNMSHPRFETDKISEVQRDIVKRRIADVLSNLGAVRFTPMT